MNNISFTGRISPELCKKLGISPNTKILGPNNLVLSDLTKESFYNRYKYGVNYKAKYFRESMDSKVIATFYNDLAPEKTSKVHLAGDVSMEASLLEKITDEVVETVSKNLDIEV